MRADSLNGVVESRSTGHERGGRHNSVGVAVRNPTIHARCQAQIICIDNELTHSESVAAVEGRERSAGQVLAKITFPPMQAVRI